MLTQSIFRYSLSNMKVKILALLVIASVRADKNTRDAAAGERKQVATPYALRYAFPRVVIETGQFRTKLASCPDSGSSFCQTFFSCQIYVSRSSAEI